MNPKNTCILVVLAAAVFAFIFFFERHLGPPPVGPVKVLPQLKPAAVKKLQLFVGENQIRVERTNDGWQVTYPIVYPAQSAAIENLVRAAAILSPETRILPEELKSRLT